MSKTLCKTKDTTKLERKQQDPAFECKKCGRKAKRDEHLCKPGKIR